jgi:hypothetical protein
MEENCDLDTSWIEKYQHHELVREPMDKVRVYLLYIHSNMSIDKIIQEDIPLETLASKSGQGVCEQGVSKEVLLKIIHDGKTSIPHKKYKLKDILVFNVDLEPSNIQSFSEELQFMKKIPIVDDIILAPSLYIFHYLNGIFIFFQEYGSSDPKPILKTGSNPSGSKPHTKKVRLNDQVEYEDTQKHNKTKRHRRSPIR